MTPTHQLHVEELFRTATAEHADLIARLPAELRESLPVDAQGLTRAIDYLAQASGLSEDERRALVRPHGVNPAVLHARIFGGAPLARETVIGSFVEGARVRAASLGRLADRIGGETLGRDVRAILLESPVPSAGGASAVVALRATYESQEQAAVVIAAALDSA